MANQSTRRRGLTFAALAMLTYSPDAVLTRLTNMQRVADPHESTVGAACVLAMWKSLALGTFNLLAAALIEGSVQRVVVGLRSGWLHVLLASLCMTAQQLGYTLAYIFTDPARALLLASLNPLWTALLGWRFLGDALPARTIVALLFAVLSVLLVFAPQMAGAEHGKAYDGAALAGDCIAFFTGVSLATYVTIVRHASVACPHASMSATSALGALAAAMVSAVLAASTRARLVSGFKPAFGPLVLLDAASLAFAYVMTAFSPRHINGAEFSMLLLLQVCARARACVCAFICHDGGARHNTYIAVERT